MYPSDGMLGVGVPRAFLSKSVL